MKETKYILYALITVLMWATLGISLKLSVTYLEDFAVALFVGIFTVLAFAVYLLLKRKFSKAFSELKKYWIFFAVAGIIGLGIQQLIYIKAYSLLPAS